MHEISFLLKKYRLECLKIDGVETHIIDPCSMEALVNDRQLLVQMEIQRKDIMPYIDLISSTREVNLYLGILYSGKNKNNFQWIPMLCIKWNNQYYHVHYCDSWRCRYCGHTVGRVLLPLSENSDGLAIYATHQIPQIAIMFQKINCPQCGCLLQGHLMLLGQYF